MSYIPTKLKREIVIDSIITIHYFEYMKDFVFKGESHDFWEILYVDKGSVRVRADEHMMDLKTGDMVFHKPNEFHAIQSIGKSSPNLVAISFTTHSKAMDFFCRKSFTLDMEERTLISRIIGEAKSCLATPMHVPSIEQIHLKENTPFAAPQLITAYLELFLIMAVRSHSGEKEPSLPPPSLQSPYTTSPPPPLKGLSNQKRLEEILQYLEFHICEHVTIPQVCEASSLSRSALQALFHEQKGCGVIEYFNSMKIDRAKDIIREGTMNITELAYFLSYGSLPYFSKQFKKATGMSPREYASSVKVLSQKFGNSPYSKDASKNVL